jgi:steroid delta-isomerase-like uncharacterized protein
MQEDKANMERFVEEAFNKGNLAVIDELTGPNFYDHDPLNETHDVAGVKAFAQATRAAFPDLKFTNEDVIWEDGKLVARYRMTGTHKGDFMGIPATNKPIDVTGIDIIRLENGKAVEHWGEFDALGMLRQMGLAPS